MINQSQAPAMSQLSDLNQDKSQSDNNNTKSEKADDWEN